MKEDDVFELVKSLSPNEKRYFKIFARQHGEESTPKYIDLFDAMDGLETYDPDELAKVLEDKRILKFLNQEKKYLKDKILDCLRLYRHNRSVDASLYRLLEDQVILYEKGLFAQSHRQLTKARKLAETYDRFSMLVEIIATERRLLMELKPKELENVLRENAAAQKVAIENLDNLVLFQNIWRTLLAYYRQEGYLSADQFSGTTLDPEIVAALASIQHARSFSAQHLFLLSRSLIARLEGDFAAAADLYQSLIQLWEGHPDRIKEDSNQFILVLSNYLNIQHKRDQYDEFSELLHKIRQLESSNFGDEAEAFQNVKHLELLYYMNVEIFQDDAGRHREIERELHTGLLKYQAKINAARRLSILFNMMMAKFFMEDWKQANHWRREIEQDKHARTVRKEIFNCCKIMEVILKFEMKDYDAIDYLHRNHKRSLQRENRLSKFHKLLLDELQQLASEGDASKQKQRFQKLEKELPSTLQPNPESNVLGAREIKLWIRYRIAGNLPLKTFIR